MSRGPGQLQRRVLQTLADYERLGPALQWKWPGARRYSLASYAGDTDIRAYEAGRRVPVWMLLRDIGCSRADLSRALGGLERQQMVLRFGGDLNAPGLSRSCKFVCITSQGDTWLKSKQMQNGKVSV
jgi:hypothetical protein